MSENSLSPRVREFSRSLTMTRYSGSTNQYEPGRARRAVISKPSASALGGLAMIPSPGARLGGQREPYARRDSPTQILARYRSSRRTSPTAELDAAAPGGPTYQSPVLQHWVGSESTKPFLPCELRSTLVHPARAVAFQVLHHFRQRNRRRLRDQQVNMVSGPSRRQQCNVLGVSDAGEVLAHLRDIRNEIETALRAENAMHQDPCVGMRHKHNVPAALPVRGDDAHTPQFICRPFARQRGLRDSRSRYSLPTVETVGLDMPSLPGRSCRSARSLCSVANCFGSGLMPSPCPPCLRGEYAFSHFGNARTFSQISLDIRKLKMPG